MPEALQEGTWLLIDAAGPDLHAGLVQNDHWVAYQSAGEGFIEALKPTVASLLKETEMTFTNLEGCLLASGPGSTLGLRLAAMFVKSLLALPALQHWCFLSYNNLSLACASGIDPGIPETFELYAPWRRDKFHRVGYDPKSGSFSLSAVETSDLSSNPLRCVDLGNRRPKLPENMSLMPYPARRIPQILRSYPSLLKGSAGPVLYSAEKTEFARWGGERHTAQ